jgi:hypothetical protein
MSGQRHPDTETLASLRSGLVGGFRGKRLAAHVARCERCAAVSDELASVSSFLASAPVPSLPENFERQITAALGAEAATRAATAREGADAVAGMGAPVLSPVGADSGGAAGPDSADADPADADPADRIPAPRREPTAPRRRVRAARFRPAMAFVPVVACLLLAGFGYLLSNTGQSSGSPSSGAQAAPASVPRTTPTVTSSASASSPVAPQIRNGAASPGKLARTPASTARPGGFQVIASGISYKAATLRAQVTQELDAMSANKTPTQGATAAGTPSLNPASSDNGGGFFSSTALTECVFSLTNNVTPSLVDEASYEGMPVFVIALPDHVWVVGRGCTASNPELVVSVVLSAP